MPRLRSLALVFAAACMATPAFAHPGHPGHETLGAAAGFAHPFSGLDHMLAMLAVGLCAALRGGKAQLLWPATFLAAMAAGFAAPPLAPDLLEGSVLGSVVLIGALTAAGPASGGRLGPVVVAAAGALHGMAHAADVGRASAGFEFGMLAATSMLHAAGLAAGLALARLQRTRWIRLIGVGVAAGGLVLAVAG